MKEKYFWNKKVLMHSNYLIFILFYYKKQRHYFLRYVKNNAVIAICFKIFDYVSKECLMMLHQITFSIIYDTLFYQYHLLGIDYFAIND